MTTFRASVKTYGNFEFEVEADTDKTLRKLIDDMTEKFLSDYPGLQEKKMSE